MENQTSRSNQSAISEVGANQSTRLIGGVVGGGVAAILSGLIWGWIIILLNAEIGYAAVGVGLLCAFGVSLGSQKSTGFLYQLIGTGNSLLGILWGKYYGFFLLVREYVQNDLNSPADAKAISLLNPELMSAFIEALMDVEEMLYNLLYIGLALYMAWSFLGKGKTPSNPPNPDLTTN